MFYIIVDKLQKVVAWSNKCGGSSVRRQVLEDLNDDSLMEQMRLRGVTSYEIITEHFVINPPPKNIPLDYTFEWYVRDPFYRLLSCFINRKILIDNDDPEITFKNFVMHLDFFRNKSSNIKSHTELQIKNYFNAPWNIIDINEAKFNFKQKMNHTKYTLGDIHQAWNIPSKDLVHNRQTYSPISFYSDEILSMIKTFYAADYEFLKDKITLI